MRTAFLCLALAASAFGEDPKRLEFDAASVKPAAPLNGGAVRIGGGGGPGSRDPGRVNYTGVSLRMLLTNAYNVKNFQIVGPNWLDSERFDVVATVPPGTTKEQSSIMLQNLLTDRFQIKLHHETKELPLYELVIGKNGPKLKKHVDDPSNPAPKVALGPGPLPTGKDGTPVVPPGALLMMMMNGHRRVVANKQTIAALTNMLSAEVGSPVVDKTSLSGEYDYSLEFTPENNGGPLGALAPPPPSGLAGPGAPPAGDVVEAPRIFTAIQDQLGLKLEQKKGPLDLIVIDQAEKVPTEN